MKNFTTNIVEEKMINKILSKEENIETRLYRKELSDARIKLCLGGDPTDVTKFCEYYLVCKEIGFCALQQCCFEEGIILPTN
ncbi:MAG TPA: hypothetical protein VMZ91_00310 [Candidatus Paceibacterota bacterium]|nr:hypothetical protein [Candidatus Paceibacterota bacterium]